MLLSCNQICWANDDYAFYNFGHNISLEQIYEEECEQHIQYVKNLKLYQSLEKIGKEIDQKINYTKTFCKQTTDADNKHFLLYNFKSGVKFQGILELEPYSYVKTELKVFCFQFCLESHLSAQEQGVIFLFEKRF